MNLRGLVKTGLAGGLNRTGVDRWISARQGLNNMPLILCYHRVVEDFKQSALRSIDPILISTKTLEAHLDWIGKQYEFVSLDDLTAWQEGVKHFSRPVAAITFDDGYRDVYEHGLPLLTRKGIPSAIFVVTDRVGTSEIHLHDALYVWSSCALSEWKYPAVEIGRLLQNLGTRASIADLVIRAINDPFNFTRVCLAHFTQEELRNLIAGLAANVECNEDMLRDFYSVDWDMLRKMSRCDVTVGSHTKSHPLLINETRSKVIDEATGSRHTAERMLGVPVEYFAYPDGQFNPEVVLAIKEAGYRCAYTTCTHRDSDYPLLTIPRRVMWENTSMDAFNRFSPAMMSCQVNGVFDILKGCTEDHRPLRKSFQNTQAGDNPPAAIHTVRDSHG